MRPHFAVQLATVRKVCQLTGETDREQNQAAFNQTETGFQIYGTDLGSSFEHAQKLWFLFGDTWPGPGPTDNFDSVASTTATSPEPGIHLDFVSDVVDGKKRYRPISLRGPVFPLTTVEYEVPLAGFSANDNMYVFHSTDHIQQDNVDLMGRSVLAVAAGGDPTDLHHLYDVSVLRDGGRFINVTCAVAPDGIEGVPFKGPALLVWGSGRYRESHVYLAVVPLAKVEERSAWAYFRGLEAGSLRPLWGPAEDSVNPVFLHPQVGELSVSWVQPLGVWLMLYNARVPRGIIGRVAPRPWGPWSSPVVAFDPGWPGLGYGHFMHVPGGADKLSDPGRENDWGGEYGPYIIDRFTRATAGAGSPSAQIYFVLSTWNPYNTVLMTETIERLDDVALDVGVPSMDAAGLGAAGSNLEVCVPRSGGGLAHLARHSEFSPPAWGHLHLAGSESGRADADRPELDFVSLAATNVRGDTGLLQVAATTRGRVVTWWRERGDPWSWHGPFPVVTDDGYPLEGVFGNPALVQSRYGVGKQNLELVVADSESGVHHVWWDADKTIPCWRRAPRFGLELGRVDALTLIDSNLGDPGNLELVARVADRLLFMWRQPSNGSQDWHGPFELVADGAALTGAAGVPSLVQSKYGSQKRNFELAVPMSAGGIALLWRDNDGPDPARWAWHRHVVLDPSHRYHGVSLIPNPEGDPGNLELVATGTLGLAHFWRDSTSKVWSGPYAVPTA